MNSSRLGLSSGADDEQQSNEDLLRLRRKMLQTRVKNLPMLAADEKLSMVLSKTKLTPFL